MKKKVVKKKTTINALQISIVIMLGIILLFFAILIRASTLSTANKPRISPSPTITSDIQTQENTFKKDFPTQFTKRNFVIDEKLTGSMQNSNKGKTVLYYPAKVQDILSFPDDQLLGLKCVSQYEKNASTGMLEKISNPRLDELSILIKEMSLANKSFTIDTVCNTEDSRTLLGYSETSIPYDYQTFTYHYAWVNSNKLTDTGTFTIRINYPRCTEGLLEITKTYHAFTKCGGGDGVAGHYTIYDTDLQTGISVARIQCSIETETPSNSCGE